MTLHLAVDAQYASPYAMSVFVALHEKALPFEMSTVDLTAGAQTEPAYATRSITRRVPTLSHDGFALSESTAICEYLDESFAGALLYPAGRQQRARARQVQAWLRSDLMALRAERPTEVVFFGAKMPALTPAGLAAADKLLAACATLLGPDQQHLTDDWSLADLDLALMLNRLALHGDAVPAHLAAYAARQWQRPSVQAWLALPRPPL
jgi:glutathione S-transferase